MRLSMHIIFQEIFYCLYHGRPACMSLLGKMILKLHSIVCTAVSILIHTHTVCHLNLQS